MRKNFDTEKTYGFLWNKEKSDKRLPETHHYDKLQEVTPFNIVSGKRGIEAGCGNGYDLRILAIRYPKVDFFGIDISDGIRNAKEICKGLKNVYLVKASITHLPFKKEVFDFAYSYGVIHHTTSPFGCFAELNNVLKEDSKLTVYLYEKHEKNPAKYYMLIFVKLVRVFSSRLPKKILYGICFILSPFVFVLFSLPSKLLSLFSSTKPFSDKIPFNFAKGPFSLTGDLYDRFGAPIEHRYSKKETENLFEEAHFGHTSITRAKNIAGWVAWGKKTE